ncbi:ABC transporter permease [Acrocarpospora sp. B8E8]|uniref:ABC transporter permease n=1 Tax=Acrocarpospora sp. B8E8 TaxID=3153572 RepID=UPI00325C634B
MSTLSHAVADSVTMTRRDFRHMMRYPLMAISQVMTPVFMMLLFVYVFGGVMGSSLTTSAYIDYLAPGILVMAVGSGAASTAVNLSTDMTEGIIARFRIMAISRASVLTGQVIGSMIRTMVSLALIIGVAMLIGFRPAAGPMEWLGAAGLLALLTLAFTWIGVAIGLVTGSAAGANTSALPLQFLPFLSSAFVPPDSMASGAAWFAEYQPFTPIIDTLRGLLMGTPTADSAGTAVAWCAGLALAGYLWARKAYNRDPSR